MVVQCYSLSLDPSLSLSVFPCFCMSLWHFALHCNSEVFAGWCRLCKLRAVFHCQRGEGSPLQSVWRWIRPSCLPAFQSPVQPHFMNTMTQRCTALFMTWSNGPSHILMELFCFLLKGYWPLCLRSWRGSQSVRALMCCWLTGLNKLFQSPKSIHGLDALSPNYRKESFACLWEAGCPDSIELRSLIWLRRRVDWTDMGRSVLSDLEEGTFDLCGLASEVVLSVSCILNFKSSAASSNGCVQAWKSKQIQASSRKQCSACPTARPLQSSVLSWARCEGHVSACRSNFRTCNTPDTPMQIGCDGDTPISSPRSRCSTSFIACWDLAKLKLPPEKTTSREAHFITYFQMYNTYNYILHSIKYLLIWHIIESTHHKIANQHIMIMRSHWM